MPDLVPPTRRTTLASRATVHGAFETYRLARLELLNALRRPESYRDPLCEFSEHLVAGCVEGILARSRVQKGWDLTTPEGGRVQVRYLANGSGARYWINWHTVTLGPDIDLYALVVFIDLLPEAILVFSGDLSALCQEFSKRHGNQTRTFQITRANFEAFVAEPERYLDLGVQVILPSGFRYD